MKSPVMCRSEAFSDICLKCERRFSKEWDLVSFPRRAFQRNSINKNIALLLESLPSSLSDLELPVVRVCVCVWESSSKGTGEGTAVSFFTPTLCSHPVADIQHGLVCALFPSQVFLLLCIADWMVHSMWKSGKDPDSFSIPYLTALGDLLGTAFLALSFHFLFIIGDQDSDVGD